MIPGTTKNEERFAELGEITCCVCALVARFNPCFRNALNCEDIIKETRKRKCLGRLLFVNSPEKTVGWLLKSLIRKPLMDEQGRSFYLRRLSMAARTIYVPVFEPLKTQPSNNASKSELLIKLSAQPKEKERREIIETARKLLKEQRTEPVFAICHEMGLSRDVVYRALRIAKDDEIADAYIKGTISKHTATKLVGLPKSKRARFTKRKKPITEKRALELL